MTDSRKSISEDWESILATSASIAQSSISEVMSCLGMQGVSCSGVLQAV